MSDGTKEAQDTFLAGLKEGTSWKNIAKDLAEAPVTGISSWAVGKFMDWLSGSLFGSDPISLEDLLNNFRNELLNDLPEAIRPVIRQEIAEALLGQRIFEISAAINALGNKFKNIDVLNADEVYQCFLSINSAKSMAFVLGINGFPIYATVLPIFITACHAMVWKPSNNPAITEAAYKRGWYNMAAGGLDEARQHIADVRRQLYDRNVDRVTVGSFSVLTGSGSWLAVDGNVIRVFNNQENVDLNEVRLEQILLLDVETNTKITSPASTVYSTLEDYLLFEDKRIERWMIQNAPPTTPPPR